MVNFDFVDVYRGLGWKKKYHAPTDHCFALKVRGREWGIKKGERGEKKWKEEGRRGEEKRDKG